MQPPSPCVAIYYDGKTARAHTVQVAVHTQDMTLEITGALSGDTTDLDGAAPVRWPLPELRALTSEHGSPSMTLTRHMETADPSPRDAARLVLDDPDMIAWLTRTRPNLGRRDVRSGTWRRIGWTLGGAAVSVVTLLFVILPALANTLAQIIPPEREVALGKSVMAQMERFLGASELGELRCDDPTGQAALDALAARLTAGEALGYELNVLVFDHDMVNAFAAPGGQVVLMRGLLDEADGPDAVAAVLAHEIGHVVARDATRAALRTVGSAGLLSLVLGDVTGGALVVFVGEQMLNTSYSREAERAADGYALDRLNAAEISSEGLSTFFDMVSDMQGDGALPEILSSHPDTGQRARLAKQNAQSQGPTRPALSQAEWRALQNICA